MPHVAVGKSLTDPFGVANVVAATGWTRVILDLEDRLTPHADVRAAPEIPEVGRVRRVVKDSH